MALPADQSARQLLEGKNLTVEVDGESYEIHRMRSRSALNPKPGSLWLLRRIPGRTGDGNDAGIGE